MCQTLLIFYFWFSKQVFVFNTINKVYLNTIFISVYNYVLTGVVLSSLVYFISGALLYTGAKNVRLKGLYSVFVG